MLDSTELDGQRSQSLDTTTTPASETAQAAEQAQDDHSGLALPVDGDDQAATGLEQSKVISDAANPSNTSSGGAEDGTLEDTQDYLFSVLQACIRPGGSVGFLEQERQDGRLGVRANQALLHHSLTHTRIEQLEKQVSELLAIVKGKEHDWRDGEEKSRFPIHQHVLRRSAPSDFTLTYEKVRLPAAQLPAIEVSVHQGLGSDEPTATGAPVPRRTPGRMVIRSRPLLSHLDDVLDQSLMRLVNETTVGLEETRVFTSVVFLRPFKLFVMNEQKIRNTLQELETKMAAGIDPKTKPAAGPGKGEPGEPKQYDVKDLQKDLSLLMEFFDTDLKATFDLRRSVRDGTDVEVEWDDLWHVFQRGDIVVSRHNPEHAYRLLNHAGGREPLSSGPFPYQVHLNQAKSVDGFALDCYSLTSDGVSYVPLLEHFSIRRYFGTQRITSLPFFPLKFHPEAQLLRAEMSDRGRLFVDITAQPFRHMLARGRTRNEPRQDLDAQVIVDMVLALGAEPGWRPPSDVSQNHLTEQDARETVERSYCGHQMVNTNCCGSDSIFADLEIDNEASSGFLIRMGGGLFRPLGLDEITEEHYVLMRPFVHAFVLRSRQWVTLNVSDLGPVVFESTFADLRIPDDHKTVVQALVKTHEAGKKGDGALRAQSVGAAMDIVKGKGHGLIILLHGAPGVGKTSTAECVADDTRRPLYPITCGDIGETALDVEKNLHKSFQLAQKWGCVLLLDEADVFLTKRTRSDLRHNAVTSVFLRSLEYYSGILFLTTNRVGVMDLAFKSRIQMTLFYPKLDLEVTLRLYEMFAERARREQEQRDNYRFRIKEREILRFAKKHYLKLERDGLDTWNGR